MIIYKKDTKGKLRFLNAFVIGDELVQESGVIGTKNPIEHRKTCKGKNIGRANETTPAEQAEKELQSLITEKLKEGYFKTEAEAETTDTLFPMLAKDFKKESHKIDWSEDVWVQPKLDGMRCLIIVECKSLPVLKSRDGRLIETMSHIVEDFIGAMPGVYDGELYAHGHSFQENMELIKKFRPGKSTKVKFHCYDVVSQNPFTKRLKSRNEGLAGLKTVEFVKTYPVKSETEIKTHHKKFLADGYEGTIVRHGEEDYKKNGRSSNLLKYKDFIDIAVPIVDIVACDQRPEWGKPVCKLPDGQTFEAGMKYSHDARKDFLKKKSKYIGKTAEIRFFEYSDTGIPRFPVMVGIRLDK